VDLSKDNREFLNKYWPGAVSVILASPNNHFSYLSRDRESLTFRLPDDNKLIALLQKTGPLIAPSANPQGLTPAIDAASAMSYFIGKVDFMVDGGKVEAKASTLVDLTGGQPVVVRQGSVEI